MHPLNLNIDRSSFHAQYISKPQVSAHSLITIQLAQVLTTPEESCPSSSIFTGCGESWPYGHVLLQVVHPASVHGSQVEVALTERKDEKLLRNSTGGNSPASCSWPQLLPSRRNSNHNAHEVPRFITAVSSRSCPPA